MKASEFYEYLYGEKPHKNFQNSSSIHIFGFAEAYVEYLKQGQSLPLDSVSNRLFIFKVQDYTTELIGRYNEEKDCYYVQRGDGSKYEYESYRIEWKRELNVC